MGLQAKKSDIETRMAGLQAQLDIIDEMIGRGETEDIHGTISDHIIQYLRLKPYGAVAKEIVTFVSAMTSANESSVRTRISKLVSQGKVRTEGSEPFTYSVI